MKNMKRIFICDWLPFMYWRLWIGLCIEFSFMLAGVLLACCFCAFFSTYFFFTSCPFHSPPVRLDFMLVSSFLLLPSSVVAVLVFFNCEPHVSMQCALPDLNREPRVQCSPPDLYGEQTCPVFPAGPQPRPSVASVPCRTSTATFCAQWPCRTSTATMCVQWPCRISTTTFCAQCSLPNRYVRKNVRKIVRKNVTRDIRKHVTSVFSVLTVLKCLGGDCSKWSNFISVLFRFHSLLHFMSFIPTYSVRIPTHQPSPKLYLLPLYQSRCLGSLGYYPIDLGLAMNHFYSFPKKKFDKFVKAKSSYFWDLGLKDMSIN